LKDTTLYYFTHSYPFGLGEQWKTAELSVLRNRFARVTIVPLIYDNNKVPTPDLPEGVNYVSPLFDDFNHEVVNSGKKLILEHPWYFLKEFLYALTFLSKEKVIIWLQASITASLIYKNKAFSDIIRQAKKGDVFYFFWGKETAEVLPLIETKGIKIYVRMHGYDLYKERNRGYIPYRQQLLKKVDKVLLISMHGYNYLHEIFSFPKERMIINRLGTKRIEPANFSTDNILRIMSCSAVINLKRVELLAKAIKLLRIPVVWTHIGAGPLMDVVRKETEVVPENIEINLLGHVNPSDVQRYYSNKEVDLFINVSTREGVSVAIMEAIAAGIPIMATNVGGTPEIVTEDSGVLIPRDIDPDTLAQKIEEYAKLPIDKKIMLKKGAIKVFEENYNSEKNAIALADILVS